MLLTFFILSFFQSPATALPALRSIETTPLPIHPLFLRDAAPVDSSCNCSSRTTFTILQNCLLTITACVYGALHPNIPDPKASKRKLAWNTAILTFYMLFFSEFVIVWAIAQRDGAHQITERFNKEFEAKNLDIKWTPVHGHYLQMGGFRRADNAHVLYSKELLKAVQDNKVNLDPLKITKKAIEDHSKEDIVSKGIAILQTLWFVLQCIVRLAEGLVLTELEVATLSFALCNAVVYAAWWHKPLNVQSMTEVSINDGLPQSSTTPSTNNDPPQSTQLEVVPVSCFMEPAFPEWQQCRARIGQVWHALGAALRDLRQGDAMSRLRNLIKAFANLCALGWNLLVPPVITLVSYLVLGSSVTVVLLALLPAPLSMRAVYVNFRRFFSGSVPPRCGPDDFFRLMSEQQGSSFFVPRFYRDFEAATPQKILTAGCILCSLIGALHFLAWDSAFPSHTHQTTWRALTVFLTAAPVSILIFVWVVTLIRTGNIQTGGRGGKVGEVIVYVMIAVVGVVGVLAGLATPFAFIGCFVTRVGLLVEAIIALRDLPPKALADIDWVQLIPHW